MQTLRINKENNRTQNLAKRPTQRQIDVLRELVNFRCEGCGDYEVTAGKLTLHRITRGNKGGKYIPRNIKMICRNCHKLMHQMEFR